jgi:hypothetical protein
MVSYLMNESVRLKMLCRTAHTLQRRAGDLRKILITTVTSIIVHAKVPRQGLQHGLLCRIHQQPRSARDHQRGSATSVKLYTTPPAGTTHPEEMVPVFPRAVRTFSEFLYGKCLYFDGIRI